MLTCVLAGDYTETGGGSREEGSRRHLPGVHVGGLGDSQAALQGGGEEARAEVVAAGGDAHRIAEPVRCLHHRKLLFEHYTGEA